MNTQTAQDFIEVEEPSKMNDYRELMIEFAKYHVKIALYESGSKTEDELLDQIR